MFQDRNVFAAMQFMPGCTGVSRASSTGLRLTNGVICGIIRCIRHCIEPIHTRPMTENSRRARDVQRVNRWLKGLPSTLFEPAHEAIGDEPIGNPAVTRGDGCWAVC